MRRANSLAYVNGEWIDREARAKRIDLIETRIDKLERLRKAGAILPSQVETLIADKKELIRLKRIHRAEYDVLYFGMEYFSEDGNADNPDNLIPAGVNVSNAADFHKELANMLDDVTKGRADRHIAYAVPRQHAKTAWLSNIFLAHQIVFKHKRYIVLFSETTDVAGDFITWTRYQLKLNDKLRKDFGELLHVQASRNELDNKQEFITTSGIKVEGKGLGTQTRGLRHGSTRPDLFILDDLESDESTSTPDQIAKAKAWFNDSMLPALAKGGTTIYLGTILCYGSLLHYVLEERRDFESRKFAAIESFSKRTDLWDEWREIYREDSPDSPTKARQFYLDNEEAMLDGVKILWPGYWSYYDLILIREESGVKSFNQEYQNNPTDEERQIFKPEYFEEFFFDDDDLAQLNASNYGAVDIAMGKDKGDFSVIVSGAVNNDTGTLYVYDAFMDRVHPNILIDEVVTHTFENEYEGLAVEAQMAQEFIADRMAEELQARGYPAHTRLKQIKQRTRKELRIESMLPDIQKGSIRFHRKFRNSPELEQFEMYGMHKHDDFPDAVSMLTMVAKEKSGSVRTVKRMNRWR